MDGARSISSLPLIFFYHWLNRFSFNALAGAIDAHPELTDIPLVLASTQDQLQQSVSSLLVEHKRVLIAFSIMTSQMKAMLQSIGQVRANFGPRIIIWAGGPHPTGCAEELLRQGVDVIFLGEAEENLAHALKAITENTGYEDVGGIAFFRGKTLISKPNTQPVNLDRFFSFSAGRGMFGPIEITRGCPFACSYCQTSHIFGTRPRHRSIENIVRQAESLRSANRKVVRLLSPNAFSYGSPDGLQLNLTALRNLLAALRETLSREGKLIMGHFPSEVRPEHVTADTLGLLKEFADNDEIVIGAQSGSRRILEACHRSHTVEDVLTAVALARKHGIKTIVDFIFGFPGESPSDEGESLLLIRKLAAMGARIHPHAFTPLPQTRFSGERPVRMSPEVLRVLSELKSQHKLYENRRQILRSFESSVNAGYL